MHTITCNAIFIVATQEKNNQINMRCAARGERIHIRRKKQKNMLRLTGSRHDKSNQVMFNSFNNDLKNKLRCAQFNCRAPRHTLTVI